MRTILVMALTANIFFSAGANYLQGAIFSQFGAASNNPVSTAASMASQPTKQSSEF